MADPHCRIGKVRPKSAEVIVLPGVTRRDLCGNVVPSRVVLQKAIDNRITDAVVVGRKPDGELHIAGAPRDMDRVVGMLMGAVVSLSQKDFQQGIAKGSTDNE